MRFLIKDQWLRWTILAVLVSEVLFVVNLGSERFRFPGAQIGAIAVTGATALTYLSIARVRNEWNKARRFWFLLSIGMMASALGATWDAVHHLMQPSQWPDGRAGTAVSSLLSGIFGLIGILSFPLASKSRRDRLKLHLDVLTVTVASATFLWYFMVSTSLGGDNVELGAQLRLLVNPLILLVVVFLVVRITLGGARVIDRRAFIVFAVANLLMVPVTSMQTLFETNLTGLTGAVSSPFLMAYLYSARLQRRAVGEPSAVSTKQRRPYSYLPYLAVTATLVLLVMNPAADGRTRGVVIGTVVIVLLVIARQLSAFHENAQLLARVDANLDELREAYEREIQSKAERDELEVELRQAQKLEAIGRLAAGVAHEINTPVQFVTDNLHFLSEGLAHLTQEGHAPDGGEPERTPNSEDLAFYRDEMPRAIAEALSGTERIATIVQAMKAFSHIDKNHIAPLDVNQAVTNTIAVARSELRDIAEVETDFGDLPALRCYVSEVNQLLLNLLVNAAHAIADNGTKHGLIKVRTYVHEDIIWIDIADNGGGIPDELRDRIFDPFFTTKEVGRGSGQGLSVVRKAVKLHEGTLTLNTVVGEGTTFTVGLPLGAGLSPSGNEQTPPTADQRFGIRAGDATSAEPNTRT